MRIYLRVLENVQSYCAEYEQHAIKVIKDYSNLLEKKKREFFGWQASILISGVLVTIINTIPFGDDPWIRVISSIFGAAVVVITGLTQLLKSRELWVYFGVTFVRLDSEYQQYKGKAGIYSEASDEKRCQLFVKNFEALRLQAATESWAIAGKANEK